VSVALTLLAAVTLALAPVRALQHSITEWLGLAQVAATLIAAWGLSRRAGWAQLLVTILAVLMLWATWRAWALPLEFRALIPEYRLWRAGRMLGVILLVGGAAAAWAAREPPPHTA